MWKSCSKCGKIHDFNYKCNANASPRTDADKLRQTYRWQRKTIEIKENHQYLCAVCRDEGRYTYDGLEVHHITKLNDDPSKAFDNDNLICLCVEHHKKADRGEIGADYLRRLVENSVENSPPSL